MPDIVAFQLRTLCARENTRQFGKMRGRPQDEIRQEPTRMHGVM
jgi:hypothetical protein